MIRIAFFSLLVTCLSHANVIDTTITLTGDTTITDHVSFIGAGKIDLNGNTLSIGTFDAPDKIQIFENFSNLTFVKDNGVYSVAWVGALPDDGLDDCFEIELLANKIPFGSTLFFPINGVYQLDSMLTISDKDIVVLGQGRGTILEQSSRLDQHVIEFRGSQSNLINVTVTDIHFKGPGFQQETGKPNSDPSWTGP